MVSSDVEAAIRGIKALADEIRKMNQAAKSDQGAAKAMDAQAQAIRQKFSQVVQGIRAEVDRVWSQIGQSSLGMIGARVADMRRTLAAMRRTRDDPGIAREERALAGVAAREWAREIPRLQQVLAQRRTITKNSMAQEKRDADRSMRDRLASANAMMLSLTGTPGQQRAGHAQMLKMQAAMGGSLAASQAAKLSYASGFLPVVSQRDMTRDQGARRGAALRAENVATAVGMQGVPYRASLLQRLTFPFARAAAVGRANDAMMQAQMAGSAPEGAALRQRSAIFHLYARQLNQALLNSSMVLNHVRGLFGGFFGYVSRGFSFLVSPITGVARTMLFAWRYSLVAMTGLVFGFVRSSIREFLAFERSVYRVISQIPHAGKDAFNEFAALSFTLSRRLGKSAIEVNDALNLATSVGFDKMHEAAQVAEATIKLATASFSDIETATRAVTNMLHSYGLEAKDAARVSDLVMRGWQVAGTDMNQFARGLGMVASAIGSTGASMEDLVGLTALLSRSASGNMRIFIELQQAVQNLIAPSGRSAGALAGLGLSLVKNNQGGVEVIKTFELIHKRIRDIVGDDKTRQFQMFSQLFPEMRGRRGMSRFFSASQKSLNEVVGATRDTTGAVDETLNEFNQSNVRAVERFTSTWSRVKISLGGQLAKLFMPALEGLEQFLQRFERGTPLFGMISEMLVAVATDGLAAWSTFTDKLKETFGDLRSILKTLVDLVNTLHEWQRIRKTAADGKPTTGKPHRFDPLTAFELPVPTFGYASGGIVTGADTGRDSVPAMLRPGEEILTPDDPRHIRRIRHYAMGGVSGIAPGQPGHGQSLSSPGTNWGIGRGGSWGYTGMPGAMGTTIPILHAGPKSGIGQDATVAKFERAVDDAIKAGKVTEDAAREFKAAVIDFRNATGFYTRFAAALRVERIGSAISPATGMPAKPELPQAPAEFPQPLETPYEKMLRDRQVGVAAEKKSLWESAVGARAAGRADFNRLRDPTRAALLERQMGRRRRRPGGLAGGFGFYESPTDTPRIPGSSIINGVQVAGGGQRIPPLSTEFSPWSDESAFFPSDPEQQEAWRRAMDAKRRRRSAGMKGSRRGKFESEVGNMPPGAELDAMGSATKLLPWEQGYRVAPEISGPPRKPDFIGPPDTRTPQQRASDSLRFMRHHLGFGGQSVSEPGAAGELPGAITVSAGGSNRDLPMAGGGGGLGGLLDDASSLSGDLASGSPLSRVAAVLPGLVRNLRVIKSQMESIDRRVSVVEA